jgi:hypothetical protein
MPMTYTRFTREEIEAAFVNYQQVALDCGQSGDWDPWCDLFTLDCTYIEAQAGMIGGREALKRLYRNIFTTFPAKHFIYSPVEWYMVDEFRGWVSARFNVRMSDPGDGSIHEEYCFSLLKYAGNGKWSHEEDLYDPARLMSMCVRWIDAKRRCDPGWDPSQETDGDPYLATANG